MIPTPRRNAATCMVRRPVGLDELRKLAAKIVSRIVWDVEYRDDLIQVALMEAVEVQAKDPDAPTSFLSKAMFRRMLRQMRHDKTNKRVPNYRPEALRISDLWPHSEYEPPVIESGFGRIESADVLRGIALTLPRPEADLVETMRRHDCGVSDAGRILNIEVSTAHRRWQQIRERAAVYFPEGLAA